MKVAMLHWGFPPIIGGVETHLIFLMPEMVKLGHEVSLLTGTAEGSKDYFDFKGAKVYRSQFYDLNWLFKSNFQEVDENVSDVTFEFLDRLKPEVIHAHNMHYFSRYHIRILEQYALKHKIPLILTAHNSWNDKLFLDLTCKIAWDQIIAISHYIKRELMAVGFPAEKITVVHHGIDDKKFRHKKVSPTIFKNHPDLKGRKNIVFHPARMGMAKGCDITIEAFRLVKDRFPDAMLIMSGSDNIIDWGLTQNKDVAFFVSLIKHLGLEDSVYINSFSLDKEMPELYRLSDVVVYPSSVEEPFGLTMLEAMASEKPIIVTDSGGMPEIIKDDLNGFVVPKRNHKALAERIIQLLANQKLREKLGKKGKSLVKKLYTKEIYTKNILKVYEKCLKNYRPQTRQKKLKEKLIVTRDETHFPSQTRPY